MSAEVQRLHAVGWSDSAIVPSRIPVSTRRSDRGGSPTAQTAASDPHKAELMAHKDDIEQQIDQLKYRKAAMSPDMYKQQLTALLLELAKTQAELDK